MGWPSTARAIGVLTAPVIPLFVVCGCAARHPISTRAVALTEAQSLVHAGCYSCLREALATLERAALARTTPEVARAAFTTSILLVVRARELGLPDEQSIERAQFWSRHVQPTTGQLPTSAYFDAIALIQGDTSGLPPRERERRATERRWGWTADGSVPPARAALSSHLAEDIAAEYIALTLDCEDAQARKTLAADEVLARHPVPLIRFRLHVCLGHEDGLRRLVETDPRWGDTYYIRGRLAMVRRPSPNLLEAASLLIAAHEAFPESQAMILALAGVRNALADHAGALVLFDAVLKVQPRHPDALLGRLLSQSYLNRHAEAVGTATALIELGTDHMSAAWYWRAWNRYHLRALAEAWRDVTNAISFDASASTYTLAGVIAYARQWPVTAIARLRTAYALDSGHCDAVWTEALVHVDQEDWRTAAWRFAIAVDCYGHAAEQGKRELDVARQNARTNPLHAREVGLAQDRLERAERRRAQSAFNAANSSARAGDRQVALTYLAVAASHPLMAKKSAELKRQILVMPQ